MVAALSAQKALPGLGTESRELLKGTKANNILPYEGHNLHSRQINYVFCYKKPTRNEIVLVGRPGDGALAAGFDGGQSSLGSPDWLGCRLGSELMVADWP